MLWGHQLILLEILITVDYLIKHNIEYFEQWLDEVDAIVIPEATCSAMINQDWGALFT